MARSLASATPAFSNYGDGIHPVSKGGFGSNTIEGIKSNIDGLDRTVTSAEGGVIPIGTNGLANLAPYGISLNSVTIKGPKYFNRSTTTEYIITNYSALKDYTVSISSGTATRNGSTITVSANIVPDAVVLTINNRNITLNKMPSPIGRPMVTLGGFAYNDNKVTITATGTEFTSSNGKTHASSTWQIASDVLFTNILAESVDDTVNKTSYVFQAVDKVPTLYVRVTYKDNTGEVSNVSPTASIDTTNLAIAVSTPSVSFTGKYTSSGAILTITGSSFVTTDGGTHASTTWQVASDSAFTNILYTNTDDTVNKTTLTANVTGIATVYYVRIRHKSSIGNVSNWSNISSVSRSSMPNSIPSNEEAKILSSDIEVNDHFGYSVSISSDGSRVAVGASYKNGSQGAVYIFSRTGSTWTQEVKLLASDPANNDHFGYSVSISSDGSRVAVGASYKNGSQGAVYIFSRTGSTWTQEAKLEASDLANDYFGYSVSISSDGSRVAVGASYKNNGQGAVYIFSRTGSTWTQEAKLEASDKAANDWFGWSTSISSDGSRVAVGASYKNGNQGAVYIFSRTGSTWTQEVKLLASDPANNDHFGYSVSISSDGSRVAVGASYKNGSQGAVYIFSRTGSTWTQEAKLEASDLANDGFGWSTSISSDGSRVAVGACYKNGGQGAVYIFSRTGSTWTQEAKLEASDKAANDGFGWSTSISSDGSRVIVGAYNKNSATGAAYIYS